MTPTHYKVVPLNEKPDDPSQLSIPIVSEAGMVTQAFLFDLKMYDPNKWKQLKPVEGILMTVERIKEVQQETEGGYWASCSGCHEMEDGHDVGEYPYSEVFKSKVGSGCRECGGLGVIWNY